jgi:hypothetical protein
MFPFVYFVTPYLVLIEDHNVRLGALLCVMVVKAFCVIIGFPSMTILMTNSCKSLSILGTLNGFATTFSALGRGFGPAISGACFSQGVKRGYVSVAWWFLVVMAVIGAIPTYHMIDGPGPSQDILDGDDDSNGAPREDSAIVIDECAVGSGSEDSEDDPYAEDEDGKPLMGGSRPRTGKYGTTS